MEARSPSLTTSHSMSRSAPSAMLTRRKDKQKQRGPLAERLCPSAVLGASTELRFRLAFSSSSLRGSINGR